MYLYSQADRDNLNWFLKDMTVASLSEIILIEGKLRSLDSFRLVFNYPISVIVGRNGSGKSTILAMAACAFHNREDGFRLSERNLSYYTFSDFFIQSSDEIPPEGIKIGYRILYDKWLKTKKIPDGRGNHWQTREEKRG